MKRGIALKIVQIQEKAAQDPHYCALWAECRTVNSELLSLLDRLPREDAAIVEDYLGIAGEMHRRMLELACE